EVASAASKNRSKQHDKCFTSINELMVTEKQRSQPADEICGLANERRRSKRLEKELRRKEKALAEAAALLTLSKKAQAIRGSDEED
ncbi:MAG: hypothetical protein WC991_02695, partial [Castellaniella sp.]